MKYKSLSFFVLFILIISSFLFIGNTAKAQTSSCSSVSSTHYAGGQLPDGTITTDYIKCNTGVVTCSSGQQCVSGAGPEVSGPDGLGGTTSCGYKAACFGVSVSPSSIAQGSSATVSWSAFTLPSSATCSIQGYGFTPSTGETVSNSGSRVVSPPSGTYSWNFTCTSTSPSSPVSLTSNTLTVTAPPSSFNVSAKINGTGGSITSTTINSGTGTVTPPDSATVNSNSTVKFTVAPDATHTYGFVAINPSDNSLCGFGSGTSTYTTGAINANCIYTFSFDPLMSGTLLPASSTCTIAAGASTCTKILTWTTTNPVATSAVTSATGTPSPVNGNNGSATFTIPYNNGAASWFTLYNNSIQLAQASVTPSCDVGTNWDGTICKTTPLRIDGACGAYHYLCATGTSGSNVNGASAWTWTCLGSNGGTNASCTETKSTSCAYPPCAVPPTLPTITTSTPTGITSNGATGGGNTISDGGSTVTQAGLVWSTMSNPTTILNGGITYDGWAIGGPWTSSITGLSSNTTYHVRAYATNSIGTSYGADVIFTTSAAAATGTLSATGCAITAGNNSCTGTITWNTVNPQGTSNITSDTPLANTIITTGNSGNSFPVSIPFNSRKFFLNNNAITIAGPATAYANCATGTGWDTVSGTCKVGVVSCSNPLAVPPACTTDVSGNCLNGAIDPTTCTTFGNNGPGVAGVCSKVHYGCTTGASVNNVNTPSQWTWTCNGTGGGSSASCVELKKKPKFIEN